MTLGSCDGDTDGEGGEKGGLVDGDARAIAIATAMPSWPQLLQHLNLDLKTNKKTWLNPVAASSAEAWQWGWEWEWKAPASWAGCCSGGGGGGVKAV